MFTHMTLDDLEMTLQIFGVGLASTIDPTHQVWKTLDDLEVIFKIFSIKN